MAITESTGIDRAAGLLDSVARTTTRPQVAVRCLLATELLCNAGAAPASPTATQATEREMLRQALRLLAQSDAAELDDLILDATHQALLAHAATR